MLVLFPLNNSVDISSWCLKPDYLGSNPSSTTCMTLPLCLSVLLCKMGVIGSSFQSHCEPCVNEYSTVRDSFFLVKPLHVGFPDLGKCQNPLGDILNTDSRVHCHTFEFSPERGLLQPSHAVALKNHNLKFQLLSCSPCSSLPFSWASPMSYCLLMANLRFCSRQRSVCSIC